MDAKQRSRHQVTKSKRRISDSEINPFLKSARLTWDILRGKKEPWLPSRNKVISVPLRHNEIFITQHYRRPCPLLNLIAPSLETLMVAARRPCPLLLVTKSPRLTTKTTPCWSGECRKWKRLEVPTGAPRHKIHKKKSVADSRLLRNRNESTRFPPTQQKLDWRNMQSRCPRKLCGRYLKRIKKKGKHHPARLRTSLLDENT